MKSQGEEHVNIINKKKVQVLQIYSYLGRVQNFIAGSVTSEKGEIALHVLFFSLKLNLLKPLLQVLWGLLGAILV